jgi:hypothetical protein
LKSGINVAEISIKNRLRGGKMIGLKKQLSIVVATLAVLGTMILMFHSAWADPLVCDPADPTCIDPKLFEKDPYTSAPDISLSAILGHWLRITGNNIYVIDDSRTTAGSVYWQFQDIVNDTGSTLSNLSVEEYATWNPGHPTQTTYATCGTSADFANCVVLPTSVYGIQTKTIEWTFSGGAGVPATGIFPTTHFALDLEDTGGTANGWYRISTVPEPATMLLLGSGLLSLLGLRRKFKK